MPRPRSKKYRDLPEGLYFKKAKGYVFHRVDNTWKSLGHDKSRAIAMARRYNATYRVDPELVHPINPTNISAPNKRAALKFSVFLERIGERYKSEEKPSEKTLSYFLSRIHKLNALIGKKPGISIDLSDVNLVLETYAAGKSNEVYNRWIAFMAKVFDYAVDESVMLENPARKKKRKPKQDKARNRLTLSDYMKIRNIAPPWLRIAMDLSLETTHSRAEICNLKYRDIEMLDQPVEEDGLEVFGYLRIHRQKVKKQEASRVVIPVTRSLLNIIEQSRDKLTSPYLVHRRAEKDSNEMSKSCDHVTQVNKEYLSKRFTYFRDKAGVLKELPKEERPTFHEIRALSIHLYDKAGYDPQARAAHTDSRSTKVYKEGHEKWVQVPAAEIGL